MSTAQGDLNAREPGLSARRAAQALGVSLGTVYRWADLGYLESYPTASGQRRFSPQQLDEFVAALERRPTDPLRDRQTG